MRLFEKAKQRSLVDFATNEGFELRAQGFGFVGKHCPYCKGGGHNALSVFPQDGTWRWNCFRCRRGGTVIDFAAAVWGVSELEAAKRLANEDTGFLGAAVCRTPAPERKATTEENPALTLALQALFKGAYTRVPEALDYLRSRGIGSRTVAEACLRGLLRFLPANPKEASALLAQRVGVESLVAAGLLRQGKRWPAIAFRPLVFFFPGGRAAEFRLARAPQQGEPKAIRYGHAEWPWWWKVGAAAETVYVVEGAIDLLSMVEMGLKEGDAVMGIPGVTSWKAEWFTRIHGLYPKSRFVIALDADRAGRSVTKGIHEALDSLGIPALEVAPEGKDWNEQLQAMKRA